MLNAKDLAMIISTCSKSTCRETLTAIENAGYNPAEVYEGYMTLSEDSIESELDKIDGFKFNHDHDDVWSFGEAFCYCSTCSRNCKWKGEFENNF